MSMTEIIRKDGFDLLPTFTCGQCFRWNQDKRAARSSFFLMTATVSGTDISTWDAITIN